MSETKAGHKVGRVRWTPKSFVNNTNNDNRMLYSDNPYFVSGSYDDMPNTLTLWSLEAVGLNEKREKIKNNKLRVEQRATLKHPGGVADFTFHQSVIITCSDEGKVHLIQYGEDEKLNKIKSKQLHSFPNTSYAPATSISTQLNVNNPEIMTTGEDGKVCFFHVEDIDKATEYQLEQSSIRQGRYHASNSIVTASGVRLKIWDKNGFKLAFSADCGDPVNCIGVHPSQQSLLVSGHSTGKITFWDLRNLNKALAVFPMVHDSAVWDICFHPDRPDNLDYVLSCSEDKLVKITCFGASERMNADFVQLTKIPHDAVNSLDISDDMLVYGTDDEKIVIDYVKINQIMLD